MNHTDPEPDCNKFIQGSMILIHPLYNLFSSRICFVSKTLPAMQDVPVPLDDAELLDLPDSEMRRLLLPRNRQQHRNAWLSMAKHGPWLSMAKHG